MSQSLQKEIDRLNTRIAKKLDEIKQYPVHGLEWADQLFEDGVKQGFFQMIKNYVEDRAAQVDPEKVKTEWTMDELRHLVRTSHFGSARPVPRSTSACSNLTEQNKASLVMSFCFEQNYFDNSFFHNAQWDDPEWNAHYTEKAARARALREAKEAEEKAKKQAEINAKRAKTRALNKAARKA